MKCFVITIMDNQKSLAAARRCMNSAGHFGYNVEEFHAFTPQNCNIREKFKEEGLSIEGFREPYSRLDNCLSAFMSHYTLWKMCRDTKEELMIFEHDAVMIDRVPFVMNYKGVISLGKPSYGKYNTPSILGVNPLTSKPYFPGAHAYRIKPLGAEALINVATLDAMPTDVFIHRDRFPFLEEYYPWPCDAQDWFTTIQNETGCIAKHNYDDKYEII